MCKMWVFAESWQEGWLYAAVSRTSVVGYTFDKLCCLRSCCAPTSPWLLSIWMYKCWDLCLRLDSPKPIVFHLYSKYRLELPLVCSHGRISREDVCFGNCVDSSGNRGHHTTFLGSTRQESLSIMGRLSDGACIGTVWCPLLIRGW